LGDSVEVIKPASLRNTISTTISNCHQHYTSS